MAGRLRRRSHPKSQAAHRREVYCLLRCFRSPSSSASTEIHWDHARTWPAERKMGRELPEVEKPEWSSLISRDLAKSVPSPMWTEARFLGISPLQASPS